MEDRNTMKIGIIGAGQVGVSLAKALRAHHSVMLSSRDPESDKMQALKTETGAQVGTVAETAAFGPVVVMALNWNAVPEAVKEVHDWTGKIIIDLTNRFSGGTQSAAQDLAEMTGARVVKAFNTIGAEHYQNPVFDGEAASMLVAGDDPEAKQIAMSLAQELGFEPVDAGGLAAAIYVEHLAGVWVHLAYRTPLGRNIAFRLIKRP
jgi:8-hydroxy-5-deazaflavin:NADPH oxidoreductase